MTVRGKVLLFASVAVGLVALMGASLCVLSNQAGDSLGQTLAVQAQTEIYGRMTDESLGYLHELLHAHETGDDTRVVLSAQERISGQGFARLRELVLREREAPARAGELARIDQLQRAHLGWLRRSEQSVRESPAGAEATLLHGALYSFREQVAPLLERAWDVERAELEAHAFASQRVLWLGRVFGVFGPLLALGLLFSLAIAISLTIRRSLRKMLEGAERLGAGDLAAELPEGGKDEYGLLARSFNRMAAQLRESAHERERSNALLEDTVHQRTAELERTNARLIESLEQLQTTQAQLLFADRLATIGQLAAGVGHEINNPLAFVLSNLNYAQQVVRDLQAVPTEVERQELLESLAEAREGAERVRLIVRDLKMLSHPDASDSGPVDLVKVVRSAAKMAAHEIRSRARLVQGVENVPPVLGNSARLCQVFLNLLINAAHAIAPGAVERNEIRLMARVDGAQRVVVEVRDTGCGIPSDKLERIFEPFYTTKPVGEGSGLGLSVCRSILSTHGGSISVESEVGRGTTFRVSLPMYGGEALA